MTNAVAAGGTTAAAVSEGFMNPAADLAAVHKLTQVFSGLFGGKETDTDRARLARAQSYLIGALHGSVLSARLALAAKQTNTSHEEQQLYSSILAQIQSGAPAVYQQAVSLGPQRDAGADGRTGLQELLRLGIRFSMPGAGHSTTYHQYGNTDPQTMQLVQQLANLSYAGTGSPDARPQLNPVPVGQTTLSTAAGDGSGGAAPTTPPGSIVPWVLLVVVGLALFFIARR